jgi:hypothetical protein
MNFNDILFLLSFAAVTLSLVSSAPVTSESPDNLRISLVTSKDLLLSAFDDSPAEMQYVYLYF